MPGLRRLGDSGIGRRREDRIGSALRMTFNQSTMIEIARNVVQGATGPGAIDELREIVRAGLANRLVSEILAQPSLGKDDVAAIDAAMTLFERIADIEFFVGGALMAELYRWAEPRFMHHVCDAVSLWMSSSRSDELATWFRAAHDRETDHRLRQRYQEWVSGLTRPG